MVKLGHSLKLKKTDSIRKIEIFLERWSQVRLPKISSLVSIPETRKKR